MKEEELVEIASKWRYNVLHASFVSIAVSRYNSAQTFYKRLMNKNVELPDSELYELLGLVQENCIESICFSVMAIESYINTFSAVYVSQDFANEVDRLDIASKWIITMQHITGIQMSRGEAPIQRIVMSTRCRNGFVHSKSKTATAMENGILIPKLKIKENLLLPAYEALLAIVDCSTWVKEHCGESFVTICDSGFRDEFDDCFKDIDEIWEFQEPSILF